MSYLFCNKKQHLCQCLFVKNKVYNYIFTTRYIENPCRNHRYEQAHKNTEDVGNEVLVSYSGTEQSFVKNVIDPLKNLNCWKFISAQPFQHIIQYGPKKKLKLFQSENKNSAKLVAPRIGSALLQQSYWPGRTPNILAPVVAIRPVDRLPKQLSYRLCVLCFRHTSRKLYAPAIVCNFTPGRLTAISEMPSC